MRFVFVLTLVLYSLNLLARFLHFELVPLPPWLDHVIDPLLTANIQVFLFEGFLGPWVIVLCGLVLLASFRWPFFEGAFFKYAFLVILTLGILPLNVWLDATPAGLAIYLLILLLLCPLPIEDARSRWIARVGVLLLFVLIQVVRISDRGDLPYIGVAIVIGLVMIAGHQRAWSSARLYLSACCLLVLLNIAITVAPQSVLEEPLVADGRVRLSSSGQAYSFCYVPQTQELFAAVNPERFWGEWSHLERIELAGADGTVSVTEIPVFDDADPKLRQIDCDATNIYFGDKRDNGRRGVGVASTATGELRTKSLFEQEAGNTFVHVAEQNRIFFFPEAGDSFIELETTSGRQTVHPFDAAAHSLFKLVSVPFAAFLTNLQAYSLERHAIYVNHFLSGSEISEIDINDGQGLRTLRTYNGLNHSLTVDRRYDRLIVSGLWGVQFLDLESGNVVQRQRTEWDARAAVIDEESGLIYVPTHFGRYLYIFDRASMRLLGRLLVGSGARNCILTEEYLVLSSRTGVYALRRADLRRWAAGQIDAGHATSGTPLSGERRSGWS